jgi:hypothetical protein
VKLTPLPGVAPEAQNELQRAFNRLSAARPLPLYASASLPPADEWAGKIVFLTDLQTIGVSTGAAWFPVTLGAML